MDLDSHLANLSLGEIASLLTPRQQEVLLASISVAASLIQQIQQEDSMTPSSTPTTTPQHHSNNNNNNNHHHHQYQQQEQQAKHETHLHQTQLLQNQLQQHLESQTKQEHKTKHANNHHHNHRHHHNQRQQQQQQQQQLHHHQSAQDLSSPSYDEDNSYEEHQEDEELDEDEEEELAGAVVGGGGHVDYGGMEGDEKTLLTIRQFAEELKQRRKAIRLSQKGAAQSLRAFTGGVQPCTDAIIYHFENLQLEPDRAMQLIPLLTDWLEWAEKHRFNGKQLPMMSAVTKVPRERKRKVVLFNEKAKQYLEDAFVKNNHPDRYQLDVISQELNIPTRSIRKWFTNRRQRKRFAEKFSPVV